MRKSTFGNALALLCGASTAVLAKVTSHPFPFTTKHGEVQARGDGMTFTSTSTTMSTSTVWDTVTVTLPPSSKVSAPGASDSAILTASYITIIQDVSVVPSINADVAADITSTIWETLTVTPPASTELQVPDASGTSVIPVSRSISIIQNNVAADTTSTILETTVVTVIAQPMVTVFMNPPIFLHNLIWGGKGSQLAAGLSETEAVLPRDVRYQSEMVTEFTTSTVGSVMTLTALGSGSLPPPTTVTSFSTQGQTMGTSSSGPPAGVTVVDVTSMVTVTQGATNSTVPAPSSMIRGTGVLAKGTTSWLNISTFVATGEPTWTYWPFGTTASTTSASLSQESMNSTITTSSSTIPTTSVSVLAPTSSSSALDNVGRPGATTVALDPQAPQSGAGMVAVSDGVVMVVAGAVGACVGLALML